MSFNLYFAGGQQVPWVFNKEDNCGKLYTFAEGPKRLHKYLESETGKIFVDSGAFSVHHSGKEVNIDEYIKFINEHPHVDLFACLDKIPYPELNTETAKDAAETTWNNYVYMLKKVDPKYIDKIVPVYHFGEPIEYIHRIINGYGTYKPKYMAFGGRAGVTKNALHMGLDNFFHEIKNSTNPNIKVHGFGITQFETLEIYPFYSADSSTWLQTGKFGRIHTKIGRTTVTVSVEGEKQDRHFNKYPQYMQDLILQEIKDNGFTYEDLSTIQKKRHLYNFLFFKKWADNFEYQTKIRPKRKGLF